MSESKDNCPICKNPRQSAINGSLTQWIVTCECDSKKLLESPQVLTSSVCAVCQKLTNKAQPGSMTYFAIDEHCSCDPNTLLEFEQNKLQNTLQSSTDNNESIDIKIADAIQETVDSNLLPAAVGTESDSEKTTANQAIWISGIAIGCTIAVSALAFQILTDGQSKGTLKVAPKPRTTQSRVQQGADQRWVLQTGTRGPFYDAGTENTDADFALLNNYSNVRSVRVLMSSKITGTGLAQIKKLPLTMLEIGSESLTNAGFQEITNIPRLEFLSLGEFKNIDARAVASLERLTKVKMLALSYATLPENTLVTIGKMKSIERLELIASDLSGGRAFQELARLPKLETLRLNLMKISDTECGSLSKLSHLRHLDLSQNEVTDAGAHSLSKMNLRILHLSGNKLTDKGLHLLTKIKSLTEFSLNDSQTISKAAFAHFANAMPNCRLRNNQPIVKQIF